MGRCCSSSSSSSSVEWLGTVGLGWRGCTVRSRVVGWLRRRGVVGLRRRCSVGWVECFIVVLRIIGLGLGVPVVVLVRRLGGIGLRGGRLIGRVLGLVVWIVRHGGWLDGKKVEKEIYLFVHSSPSLSQPAQRQCLIRFQTPSSAPLHQFPSAVFAAGGSKNGQRDLNAVVSDP